MIRTSLSEDNEQPQKSSKNTGAVWCCWTSDLDIFWADMVDLAGCKAVGLMGEGLQSRAWSPVWRMSAQGYLTMTKQWSRSGLCLGIWKWQGNTHTLFVTYVPMEPSAQSGSGEHGVTVPSVGLQRIWLHESLQSSLRLLRQGSQSGRTPGQARKWCSLMSMVPGGFITRYAILLSFFNSVNP